MTRIMISGCAIIILQIPVNTDALNGGGGTVLPTVRDNLADKHI